MRSVTLLLLCALGAAPARAEDPATVKPALTVGLLEVVGLHPEVGHFGLYVATSVDLLVPLDQDWTLIPSLGFEFAPEFGNWGGTFFLSLDRFLTKLGDVVVTLQPQLGVIHDAMPDGEGGFSHTLYLCAGGGLGLVTNRGAWLPHILVNYDLRSGAWSLSPLLLFSVTF